MHNEKEGRKKRAGKKVEKRDLRLINFDKFQLKRFAEKLTHRVKRQIVSNRIFFLL